MSWFSSKTKYYVASSSFPIFDADNRVNQYAAGMLDYVSNSKIEHSEYFKQFYSSSRLRGYKGFLNWWKRQGNFDTFGKISAKFYGDASLSNSLLVEGLKQYVSLQDGDVFSVYHSELSFFSEDFWIKHLATQQGKADWVLQDSDIDYEISYPSDTTIRATFTDGRVIEGELPGATIGIRFLNLSWSILRQTETTEVIPPDEEGGESTTITTTTLKSIYGYYCYQEASGNSYLDEAMAVENTGTAYDDPYTFFPVIPIRTNTSWFNDENRKTRIIKALDYLEIMGKSGDKEDSYTELQKALAEGAKKGSLKDIDYITLLLGVSIGTTHRSDLRYLYEFFLGLHTNYRLRNDIPDPNISKPKNIDDGSGNWNTFIRGIFSRFEKKSPSTSFLINCAASNLNYTYEWDGSDYFETNGQWKPGAKPGDYGVLSGAFVHHYSYQRPQRDSEGNIRHTCNEDGCRILYETVHVYQDYSLTFFCRQVSANRWRFVVFVDLGLINLIYHGKTIYTSAHSGVMDAAGKAQVTHTFDKDFPSAPGEYYTFTLNYITSASDGTNAFVVPLEQNTFNKIGAVHQLEISYGSQYLICNCWQKKKVKWYQRGWFSVFLSFAGLSISLAMTMICPIVGWVGVTYFATMFAITLTAQLMQLTLKIFQGIFGEHLGTTIYNIVKTIIVCYVSWILSCIPVFGWLLAAALIFTVTAAEAINSGQSMSHAVVKGIKAGSIAAIAAYAGGSISEGLTELGHASNSLVNMAVSSGIQGAITTAGMSWANGASFLDALKTGLIAGIASAAFSVLGNTVAELFGTSATGNLPGRTEGVATATNAQQAVSHSFTDFLTAHVIENPFTYVNLMGMAIEDANYHKLANLENDYQEFNNAYKTALSTLEFFYNQQSSLATAEFVCKLQANIGKMMCTFPDMMASATPDKFIGMALMTGSNFCDGIIQGVSMFVDNNLALPGYESDQMYYNQAFLGWTGA